MKLAVLGATGRAGRLVVAEALDRGWDVRALARDPTKVTTKHARLTVVRGEATEARDVAALIEGCDAVVSALGIVNRSDVCSTATAHVLAAIKRPGRYVVVGGAGSALPGEDKPLSGKIIHAAMSLFSGPLLKDKDRELAMLVASDVDWTVARPPVLREGPKAGARVGDRAPINVTLTYADLAAFLVEEVEARKYVRAAPYVSR